MKKLISSTLLLVLLAIVGVAHAKDFRFTITADPRPSETTPHFPIPPRGKRTSNVPKYRHVLESINAKVGGEGAFHIVVGDLDSTEITGDLIQDTFGKDVVWYAVVGNHDDKSSDLKYIYAHNARQPYIKNRGPERSDRKPVGVENTTFSFDYHNAHFVILDQYYDGKFGTQYGDIDDATFEWLKKDLESNKKPVTIVFGHEPAYPEVKHIGDSLDGYPEHRDRFWRLLARHGVTAYVTAHTHYYSKVKKDGVWQIDMGNAGHDYMVKSDGLTFVDVTVSGDKKPKVRFDVWRTGPIPRNNTDYFIPFKLIESIEG